MCGRFSQTQGVDRVVETFDVVETLFGIEPRYNIAPTQTVGVVCLRDDDRVLAGMRWGLVPSWAKDVSIGNRMINARSETAAGKPAFRAAFRRRRCLVPADGFYEWQKVEGSRTKQPFHIRMADASLFGLAGLWEHWQSPDGSEVETFTVLTTEPNDLMRPIHDRMPVIIDRADYAEWLAGDDVSHLLTPYPADAMEASPVGTYVNKPAHEGPRCLERDAGLFG